jgi:hypothetical protein
MAGSRTLKLSILADVDNLKKSLDTGSKDVQTFGDKITNFGKIAGAAFLAAGVAATGFAIKIGVDAVKAASDLSETISKVNVLFGTASSDIQEFASSAAGALGQTKQQALDAAATFATFGKAAGLSGQDLSNFSIDFVKLSSDLASFNNTSPEQAINAIGSALRGEAEPLRAYGVLLDDASLRQAALELGIVSTTKNALTPQQKVLAAQKLIFEQTGAAQGDFERTSDGLANKTRILTAELENAKVTIGDALLPIVLELATFISETVIPIIQNLSQNVGENLTPVFNELSTFFKENLIPIIKVWWEFLTKTVIPGITKTVEPIIKGLFKAFNSIATAIKDNEENLAPLYTLFVAVAGFVSKTLAPALGTVLGAALQVVGKLISGLITGFSKLVGVIDSVLDGIKAIINLVKNNPLVRGISGVIDNIFGGGRAAGGPVNAGTTYLVGEKGPELFTPSNSGNIIPNNRLSAASGGNTININVTGAMDPVGVARQIASILNREATTSGAFTNLGLSRVVAG